ncbi:MAG: polysaccharide deacetylase family protein [Planctomycetota bacterium]|nr:MAG: polysaccharide deacetylase family protein [Planctomycetota bacterium]REJ89000.1 MAG: polysaccharide deacetylase family protein [Planctomycetota bacterium]
MSAKQRIKLALLWLMRSVGLFALARWKTRHGFAVLGWHGVSLLDEHTVLDAYFVSPEVLRRRLTFLSRHFRIVPLAELIDQQARGQIEPRQVALTFDDAMYNFGGAAVPVLREFDAAATVYVISSTLERPSRADMLLLQYVVVASPLGQTPDNTPGVETPLPMTSLAERHDVLRKLRAVAAEMTERGEPIGEFVEQMAELFGVDLAEQLERRVWDYLTADEVCELAAAGYDMQLHSHRHQYATENLEDLAEDTRICRQAIEAVTQREAVHYCYPAGRWNRRAREILAEVGMRSGVTCGPGQNDVATNPLSLKRHVTGNNFTQLEFEYAVSGVQALIHWFTRPAYRHEPPEISGAF